MGLFELIGIVILAIIVAIVIFFIAIYNGLINKRNQIKNSWAQIDVQLKRRLDLIPNLVETVQGYAKHEKETFKMVTEARSMMASAGTMKEKAVADNMLTGALKSLFAVAESYPELKANQNFLMLQEELAGTENKIASTRQFYNDSVLDYNNMVNQVPSNVIAGMFGFKDEEYFKVDAEEAKDIKKAPKVKF